MNFLLLGDLLPDSSTYYAVMMGVGFFLGVYAHAAKMPRLVAFSIMLVFLTTLLTLIAARTFQGDPGAPLP
ncbi:MAG: hypothetical protein WBC01_14035 [Solirubrobacterales bacterium]